MILARKVLLAGFGLVALTSVPDLAVAQDEPKDQPKPQSLSIGGVLSGELLAIRSRRKGVTYQLTSDRRRLPSPGGLCNLENGPETFELIASSAEEKVLKPYLGKNISVK